MSTPHEALKMTGTPNDSRGVGVPSQVPVKDPQMAMDQPPCQLPDRTEQTVLRHPWSDRNGADPGTEARCRSW